MDPIYLTAFPEKSDKLKEHRLPLQEAGSRCSILLRNLPGASHIHVLLSVGNTKKFRAEIPADNNETVWVDVELDAAGSLQVQSPGRNLMLLRLTPGLPPTMPIYLDGSCESLDLAIVIDGSSRIYSGNPANATGLSLLLANKERWGAHVDKLCRFIEAISQNCKTCRIVILAFGDQAIVDLTTPDLGPVYQLYPRDISNQRLQPLSLQPIQTQLLTIPPTSGGDFVDALADALAACNRLNWQPRGARKLVLISGDSPGHSILYPAPKGADACIRENDVDTQALRLHRQNVELLSIYHDPEMDFWNSQLEPQRELLQYAQEQYRRLASLPELALVASQFDGAAAAETWWSLRGFIGRGGTFGELLQIEPATGEQAVATDG